MDDDDLASIDALMSYLVVIACVAIGSLFIYLILSALS
jgi:hypothetical protein